MMDWLTVFVIALVGIILYFLIRFRQMMAEQPGATSGMGTVALIKNWQENKAEESKANNALRAQAREAAKEDVKGILFERYKQEEVKKMTTPKSEQMKANIRDNLGFDINKAVSDERMDRMIGRNNPMNPEVNQQNIFDRNKIKDMTHTDINSDKLRRAAGNSIDWDRGVDKGLRNDNKLSGVERALYGSGRGPKR